MSVLEVQRLPHAPGLPAYQTPGAAGMDLRAAHEGALRSGVTVLNSPGTIDADYRGELMVLLINLGGEPAVLVRGERIAQLVIAPAVQLPVREVASLDETERGAGGFGSTGRG
jgi:dUTP pyrophosphatase